MKNKDIKSREHRLLNSFTLNLLTLRSSKSRYSLSHLPVLGKTLLGLLPALFYGCTTEAVTSSVETAENDMRILMTKGAAEHGISTLDIFVFKDDDLRMLDCYQRIDRPQDWEGDICSSAGDRIICICANSRIRPAEWPLIRSQGGLEKLSACLEAEDRDSPFMSGKMHVTARKGHQAVTEFSLRPLVSEIYLRSISCDFKGKPYAGEEISDVKVYLTNVNAECSMFSDGDIRPERLINVGGLNMEDMKQFAEPSLIFQELSENIGRAWLKPEIRLWCYPSNASEESIGTPFSRLVIEGKISGSTYYWPIDINRKDGNDGISRNRQYIYDVKITRKGSLHPDIPVEADDIEITFKTKPWEEKKDCIIGF